MNDHIQNLTESKELDHYEKSVNDFLKGQIGEDKLMVVRLQQGIYGQRQENVYMIRIKLPGGLISPHQLNYIAKVLESYSNESIASITTRQDIQIHSVPLEKTPGALRLLAEGGLTTREACGNTVRNVSACPLAGVCPREHTDVQPFLNNIVQYFIRHPLTQHMPRKFKISFSGCESDCAQGMIHDVGIVAVQHDGKFGFKVLAGGGLGHKPRQAIVVEPFINEKELIPVIEAIISVHVKYSDRNKRAKSRIKFLVDRFGKDGFYEKYRKELTRTRDAFVHHGNYHRGQWSAGKAEGAFQAGAPRNITEQKQPGLYVFPISVPLGDLTVTQLRGIASLMLNENLNDLRTTQDQNLVIANVNKHTIASIQDHLGQLGLAQPATGDDVVACPGTWTCRLGITASKNISKKLDGGNNDLSIRVSGCQNGCAQPTVSDIGIHGEAKRFHGKLVPHYRMFFGGDGKAGGQIGIRGPDIPTARIEKAITKVKAEFEQTKLDDESFSQWNSRQPTGFYHKLLAKLIPIAEFEVPFLTYDHGEKQEFKVLQLGGGECAGVAQEDVAAFFAEAANERSYMRSFSLARKHAQALDCTNAITRLISKAIIISIDGNHKYKQAIDESLHDISGKIKNRLPDNAYLFEPLTTFEKDIKVLSENFEQHKYENLIHMINCWTILAGHFCQEKNHSIDLTPTLPAIFLGNNKITAQQVMSESSQGLSNSIQRTLKVGAI